MDGSGTTLTGVVWDFHSETAAKQYTERIAAAAAADTETPIPGNSLPAGRRWVRPDRVVIVARHRDLVVVTTLRGQNVHPDESVLYSRGVDRTAAGTRIQHVGRGARRRRGRPGVLPARLRSPVGRPAPGPALGVRDPGFSRPATPGM